MAKFKDQVYDTDNNLKLDVFAPRKANSSKKILVFIHGGNWVNGKKSLYHFFGKGMARKNIVCVVISYRLSPRTDIEGMANDVAKSIKWIKENSTLFHGDTSNIFVSGHSAGGHLAAMVATDDSYFQKLKMSNPTKGVVLIDAYGLDVYSYLKASTNDRDSKYYPIFSTDQNKWKKYSPIFDLNKNSPAFIQFVGGKTNQIIKDMNGEFYTEVKKYQPEAKLIVVKRKRHVPMIFQFYNPYIKSYKDIVDFIKPY
ncbi:MAG: alpha/beta hydrolase [Bacteroidota bacterium]